MLEQEQAKRLREVAAISFNSIFIKVTNNDSYCISK